jgi:repressor LexA
MGPSIDAVLAKWNTRTPARKPLGLKKGDLSPGQKRVFDAIVKFISVNGFPPTNRDLCRELGYASPNAIFGFTQALARKNWIRQQSNKSRSITLL